MGSDCCLAGTKDNLTVLPCYGHRDGKPLGMLGVSRLFGRDDQLVRLDRPENIQEEAEMLIPEAPGMFVAEGCTLDRCYRAECKVSPGCMQGAGPEVPGSDSVAAEGAAHGLRMGC